ncbi:MAG: EAL domain-containing protein [Burkholderiales bacterium]|nr:EAL domain-containing protein [Burkholderiales bacterium]
MTNPLIRAADKKFGSLSAGISAAMCVGLLVPAIIGGMVLTGLRQQQMEKEIADHLEDKINLLAISLPDPVWSLDTRAVKTLTDALMSDPQVVRVTVSDPKQTPFLSQERGERRLGAAIVARRELKFRGNLVGHVELELDDALHQRELQQSRAGFFFVFFGQFVLALGLILLAIRARVLRPLARLSAFSNQLASGNLERALDWSQTDEIGRLARQLDQMRNSLRTSFAEQQAILNNVQVGVIFMRDRTIQLANRQAERIFGYGAGEMHEQSSAILYLSDEQFTSVGNQAYTAIATNAGVFEQELRLNHRNGGPFWARMRGCALDPSLPQAGSIWVFDDITELRRTSDQLRLSATVFQNTADGVIITDRNRCILAVNASFLRITGYRESEVIGKTPTLLSSGRQGAAFYESMWRALRENHQWQGELWNRRKSGEIYPEHLAITGVLDAAGELVHYVGVFSDITVRKATENEIRHLAFYDPLTKLPNRRLMMDRLTQALSSSARYHRHGALMMIDLDNFKTLNDTLGHDAGDQLLIQVASRLESCVRTGDSVARLGGDEFVVILKDLDETDLAAVQAENVARKILSELSRPYLLNLALRNDQQSQHSHDCTASLGIALFRDLPVTTDDLMKWADTAMYQAKAAGRNTLRFFDPDMQAAVMARAAKEVDLRTAIVEKQFHLCYQAQVDATGRMIGAEALLRWQHPKRGLVLPLEFVPLAEKTGLILPLGQWVLEAACTQLATWATEALTEHLTLAVNVSARQFRQVDFVDQVLRVLDHTGANPQRLKLELTESLLADDVEDIIEKMTALKKHGVSFSLDDFGTGYSSLAYLKRLPLDQLKIDRSFVRDVLTDTNDAIIARTIVALGQSLGLNVIAEGVETDAQRNFLASHGCLTYQGYFFSRPIPLPEFEALSKEFSTRSAGDAFASGI